MGEVLQVAAGGAIGAVLRYGVVSGAAWLAGPNLPLGTLAANALGSFLMGALASLVLLRPEGAGAAAAPFLMTGLLGGFTTFSAFSLDAVRLWQRGEAGLAAAYVGGSVALSLGALLAGLALGRRLAA